MNKDKENKILNRVIDNMLVECMSCEICPFNPEVRIGHEYMDMVKRCIANTSGFHYEKYSSEWYDECKKTHRQYAIEQLEEEE